MLIKLLFCLNGVQKYFKDEYNRETIYIPNGVNVTKEVKSDIIEKKFNLKENEYILFLARIVPEKGLHYLIEAYKQIKTDKKLVIAGGASHTNDYLKRIKDMIQDDNRIIMTGFVQGKELEELYSNCYLYCLPSSVEGMPLSLLEAMSYGCHCLVSDIAENTQVTENYAETFKKENVEDLKIKIEQELKKNYNMKSRNIREFISRKYDWNKIVKRTEELYKCL